MKTATKFGPVNTASPCQLKISACGDCGALFHRRLDLTRKFVTLANQTGERVTKVARVTKTKPMFHFSDF
jgi:hypothetical protein